MRIDTWSRWLRPWSMKKRLCSFSVFLLTTFVALSQLPEANVWHKFTEAKTGKTVVAKVAEKKPDNSKVRIVLKKGGTMWLNVDRFSGPDIEYIKAWELTDLRLEANTVASARSRTRWSETWGKFDANGVEIISVRVSTDFRSRTVGITLDNRGSVEDFVMEVFWLGFPLKDKTRRVINSLSARKIKVPKSEAGERYTIRVGSTYKYTDASLLYLRSDRSLYRWEGIYIRTWSGYGYAGWAVRISDGEGNLVDQTAAQPSFLKHIQSIPLPVGKK